MNNLQWRSTGLFDLDENEITPKLFHKHSDLFAQVLLVLELFNDHLDKVSGKIKVEERRMVTILNFLGQNLKFINKAYLELTRGYIRIPSSLLKIVTEQLVYSLIFAEFPSLEEEFNNIGNYKFARKYPKSKLLNKINQEGRLFKTVAKPSFWNDVLEKEMYSQLNEVSHPNPNSVFAVMFDEESGRFSKGPRLHDDKLVKSMIRLILLSLVFSIVIVDTVFSIKRDPTQDKLMKDTTNLINKKLNSKNLVK